jgi:group I intron endonuclease
MTCGIYMVICNITEKVYIGQSNNLEYRLSQYKHLAVLNQVKIYRSLKKYGFENHKFEIIETIDNYDQDILDQKEQYYMDLFRENGYVLLNLREAGNHGIHSEETKRKISLGNKGKHFNQKRSLATIEKIRLALIGNKHRLNTKCSEETKRKMSLKRQGRFNSEKCRQKISDSKKKIILQYDMDMNFIKEYPCALAAQQDNNFFSAKHIRQAATGSKQTAYGFIWAYKSHKKIIRFKRESPSEECKKRIAISLQKAILQYDLNMNFIKEYPSAFDATIENNFRSSGTLRKAANGFRRTAYGFIWKYKNNE